MVKPLTEYWVKRKPREFRAWQISKTVIPAWAQAEITAGRLKWVGDNLQIIDLAAVSTNVIQASLGDWVIMDSNGRCSMCSAAAFETSYERIYV